MNILHEVSKVYDTRVNPVHIEGEVRRGGAGGWRCLRSARHTQHSAAGGGGCALPEPMRGPGRQEGCWYIVTSRIKSASARIPLWLSPNSIPWYHIH
jgi:hypothetical protein